MHMEWLDERTIKLDKELNDLDLFTLRVTRVISKYSEYVLVSGYVSILFGNSRTSEDIDIVIQKISKDKFLSLFQDLERTGFWPVNVNDKEELFEMLNDNLSIRFADKEKVIPNVEIKIVKDALDTLAIKNRVKVNTAEGPLYVADIALQIAYKEEVLKSNKDLEDAEYLRRLFRIPEEKINKWRTIIHQYGR